MTQQIARVDEWSWVMEDDYHHLWASSDLGVSKLQINRYLGGELGITLMEMGAKTKIVSATLNRDIAKSLLEFLNQAPTDDSRYETRPRNLQLEGDAA
jgi:hypothetical protein